MKDPNGQGKFDKLKSPAKAENISARSLVRRSFLNAQKLPIILEPALPEVDLAQWARVNRTQIESDLLKHGAILFRNSRCRAKDFEALVHGVTDRIMSDRGGAAIRTRLKENLYTSTEYPNELQIRLHNEYCYSHNWPMKLFFFCLEEPTDGGQTPLVDSRAVYRAIRPDIRERFEQKGLLYIRNYKYNRNWRQSYETDSRELVERVCRQADRTFEWGEDDSLKTSERRPSVRSHPATGEPLWFNFAHGFHVSRMDEMLKAALSTDAKADNDVLWPNNAFYGDGSPIAAADIEEINETIERNLIQFDWRLGDVLLIDNMMIAHGRRPFRGRRKILVQMAEPYLEK